MDSIAHEIRLRTANLRKLSGFWGVDAPSIRGLVHNAWVHPLGTWHLGVDWRQGSQFFVDKILHCKCRAGKEHEFLIFEVLLPKGDGTVCLVLTDEMRAGSRMFNTMDIKFVVSRVVHLNTFSQILLRPIDESYCPLLNQIDIVFKGSRKEPLVIADWGKYDVLRTLTYPPTSTRPSALHLCAIMQAALELDRDIKLGDIQCYWYANTIFLAFQDIFPGGILCPGRKEKKRGSLNGVKLSTEVLGVNCHYRKYIQRLEAIHAVRDSTCFLSLTFILFFADDEKNGN